MSAALKPLLEVYDPTTLKKQVRVIGIQVTFKQNIISFDLSKILAKICLQKLSNRTLLVISVISSSESKVLSFWNVR